MVDMADKDLRIGGLIWWQDWRSVQADCIFFCPKANISLSLYFGKC